MHSGFFYATLAAVNCMIKPYILPLVTLCCSLLLLNQPGIAQEKKHPSIAFKQGLPAKTPALQTIDAGSYGYYFLQFNTIPGSSERKILSLRGIDLLDYIPQNTYLARVRGKWMPSALSNLGITGSLPLDSSFKRSSLESNTKTARYRVLKSNANGRREVSEQVLAPADLAATLNNKDVLYLMPAAELKVLTDRPNEIMQIDRLQLGMPGQPGLDGSGVVVGVGDNGMAYHLDLHYNEAGYTNSGAAHATHVSGTVAGGGYINPLYKGVAPGATLINDLYDYVLLHTPEYYRTRGMVITNNSYGAGSACYPVSGQYSIYCAELDQLMLDYPEVSHVFAAGNSLSLTCGDFPMGYKAIDNAYQAAKNAITVGGGDDLGFNYYSKGPVMDGRLKPEVVAMGSMTTSTGPDNTYYVNDGTSMASPQVAGCLALMYQHYRQLNAGKNPPSDLMKAVLCNTATDVGRKGVDFEFGFGWVNPADAIDLLTKKFYFSDAVDQGGTKQFQVTINQSVRDLRFMLYWADKPASLYSKVNLVNDLDISVRYPDGSIHRPMVLDTSAAGVLLLAQEGEDHLNNIEQVRADIGSAGTYTITVRGSAVPFGPQAFQLAYYYRNSNLKLLQPIGAETWKSGDTRRVLWQYPGNTHASLNISFSPDNGASWTPVGTTQDSLGKSFFNVPNTITTQALIRITDPLTGATDVSAPFAILPNLGFSLQNICADTIRLRYSKPAGIDSVLVYQYDSGSMAPKFYSTDTILSITGSRPASTQWISLAPVKGGIIGERSIAQSILPASNACAANFNGDLALRAILLPANSRAGSTSAPLSNITIKYIIENKGTTTFNDSLYSFIKIDGNPVVREGMVRSIAAGALDTITALTSIPATAIGLHPVFIRLQGRGDQNPKNDSLLTGWTYLPNPLVTVPFTEDFTAIGRQVYSNPGKFGITGASAWDFSTASTSLKLFTAPGDSAGLYSSSRMRYQSYQLLGTYNLSRYRLIDNIYLDLSLPSVSLTQLTLQVRGADNRAWITIPTAFVKKFGGKNLNIGFFLAIYGQSFSASTQLRLRFTDNSVYEKLSLLNRVKWYSVPNDVSVDGFVSGAADILTGDSLGVRVLVQNQSLTTQYNIPVSFQCDGIELSRVFFDSLPPLYYGDTALYLPTNRLTTGLRSLYAIAEMSNDALRANDTGSIALMTYSVVKQYPYYQGFEQGRADWYHSQLYQLNDSVDASLPVFAAPNGKAYWRTQPAFRGPQGYDAEFDGFLVSPAFDLSTLDSPMLSMSVNKQLCDGKDSVIIQASPDNGLTWIKVDALANATHLYDSTAGSAFMSICDSADWQVVSLPLPKWSHPSLVRIASNARENRHAAVLPKLSAGLLVDDIFVYDGHAQLLRQPVRALAMPTYNGHIVLPRLWTVMPKDSATKKARLFFTHEEWRHWIGRKPCDTCALQTNPYGLSVFRYAGPPATIDQQDINNRPDFETEMPADSFNLIPYKDGYLAEIDLPASGEYYIGLPGKGAGIQFDAQKQSGANVSVLNWSMSSMSGINGFAVERSVRNNGVDGPFEQIAFQNAGAGMSYRYDDNQITAPAGYHYRIRIDYNNGSSAYSYVETISYESSILAKLYPNPWQSGELHLFLANMEGRRVDLQLFDVQGRLLWSRGFDALTAQQTLSLEEAVRGRPAGVYFLKMNAMGQKTNFRLVVSGK